MTDRDTYYAAAQSWADERVAAHRKTVRLAWTVAAVAGAIALVLAITVALMLPLKAVQPYVVTVDRQTGAVEMATTVNRGRLTENEAVIDAQLANYVRVRETFDATDLPSNYRRVQLMSAANVRNEYIAAMSASNPSSPLHMLSPGDTLAVRIKSVSLLSRNTALVRFETDRTMAGTKTPTTTPYVSALTFGFSDKPLRAADRFDNPLGFQVTRYRRDVEGMTR